MPAVSEAKEKEDGNGQSGEARARNGTADSRDNGNQDQEDEEDEEDEPRLKYSQLTGSLSSVYRGGDATSTFMVGGDKLIIGTHNGNIHVFSNPAFQSLRFYRAHSASITAVSISPVPAVPPANSVNIAASKLPSEGQQPPKSPSAKLGSPASPRTPRQPTLPNTLSNQIYIATASIDGHVCVSSLLDPNDVMLRNFARPVQAVALSPDYKNDRTYLSGGLAGNLIATVGGKAGISADANTNSAAAAASGWLGSIGLGSNTGKDTVLHSGEGSISTIQFSRTSKYVAWINEHGIKIMRSHLKLDPADAGSAWKRIAHIDRPNRGSWEDMASVWKGRAEWVSDKNLEVDNEPSPLSDGVSTSTPSKTTPQTRKPEKLVVGWGDTAWVVHVRPGGAGVGKHVGERSSGSADIVHKLTFDDCVISGLSLYTPSLLAILAYRTRDDNDNPLPSSHLGTPRRHRQSGLPPELRLIDVQSGEEMDVDTLPISRSEQLSAADYHLGTLYIPPPQHPETAQRGALESLNAGFWEVGSSATRLFGSGGSVRSAANSGDNGRASAHPSLSVAGANRSSLPIKQPEVNPSAGSAGLKLFVHSPYDFVLAVKRDMSDHLDWLMQHRKYGRAWELIDEHPSVIAVSNDRQSIASGSSTPTRGPQGSLAEFFADDSASQTTVSANRAQNSAAAKEKRRIGDLWLQQLVSAGDWKQAGTVAGTVLGTSSRWEHWVLAFAQADHFDEITPFIPSTDMRPPLPSFVYELVLGHYISHDRPRFAELLDQWDPQLFDIPSVTAAIENKLETGDITEETTENGEKGRDWRILMNALARLKLADGSAREALHCCIRLQNADAAMSLIRDYHLVDSLSDDIPGLLLLRVSRDQLKTANISELREASNEVVQLLVDEAYSGVVQADTVVQQLESRGKQYHPFLYFYLASMWRGPHMEDEDRIVSKVERLNRERRIAEGQMVVEQFADLALSLFANYDRDLLMAYLRQSTAYSLDKASTICENKHYVPEQVYLFSKTGQTRRALFLIIEELGDVSQAISFAKEHTDLWDDLLDYSMDRPPFIRALLSEVGTAINPIQLIRRIPDGLEIEGLKEGIQRMVREYDIQYSISEGVAKVFRGEVASGMDILRAGQKRGVKFEVRHSASDEVEVNVNAATSQVSEDAKKKVGISKDITVKEKGLLASPGHCVGCGDVFEEEEHDFMVGFACGHVFHLMCLLDYVKASKADYTMVETLQSQTEPSDSVVSTRSVGAKVAHAQVIRSAIKSGCPVCVTIDGA